MRLGFVAPAVLSLFVAVACGGKDDPSQVQGGGTAATGNNGTGGNGLVVGGDGTAASANSANGPGVDPGNACATSAADGEPIPVDLYFMVDTTGSMNCPVPDKGPCTGFNGKPPPGDTRWTVVSAALKSFVADQANKDLGMGLRFFPTQTRNEDICAARSYAKPNTEIGPLSTNAPALTVQINAQQPDGETPTVPSLQAAIDHASAWAKAHPTHKVAVVYSTDGYPRGCDRTNTIDTAATIAAAAFAATPSISTYVLGVGPNLTDLEKIATAGSNGTTKAFLVDTSQNAATQLSAALAAIRGKAVVDCTYTIPAPPSGQTLEAGKVNVNYTDSKGTVTKVLQDAPNVTCDKGIGWQYSADGTQINLCGSACSAVKADPGGKIQVLFGCTTEVGNPP
jgi:hypothetical protein